MVPDLPQLAKRPNALIHQPRAHGIDVGNLDLQVEASSPRRAHSGGEPRFRVIFFQHELGSVEVEVGEQRLVSCEEHGEADAFDVEVKALDYVAHRQFGNERIPTHSPIMAYVRWT